MPTLLMYTSPPETTWQPNKFQSSSAMGSCLCASVISAVKANVFWPTFDISRITRFRSDATGPLSWSRMRVLLLTGILWVPSNRTLAVTTPSGLSFFGLPMMPSPVLGTSLLPLGLLGPSALQSLCLRGTPLMRSSFARWFPRRSRRQGNLVR